MSSLTKVQFIALVFAIDNGDFVIKDSCENDELGGGMQAIAVVNPPLFPAAVEIQFELNVYIPAEDVSPADYGRHVTENICDMVLYELCNAYLVDENGEKTALGEELPEMFERFQIEKA